LTSEVNFDGLVGPTHNYAGLSYGNHASIGNAGDIANPRAAALQGLDKMRFLTRLGLTQGVLPPQQRPDPQTLEQLGLSSATTVAQVPPELQALVMSASAMWSANAATVSPSADTADGRVHMTPANLTTTAHRALEAHQTTNTLRTIFADTTRFQVHEPLPGHPRFADEGAANHGRLAKSHSDTGTQIFVYGRTDADPSTEVSSHFPRRQTRLAGELIARSHGLTLAKAVFLRQSDVAVDAGAFHNDVVAVVNESVIFHHQDAFAEPLADQPGLAGATIIEVGRNEVPLKDAITSYLFNSQLVTLPDGTMALIAPSDVDSTESAASYLADAVNDPANPIGEVHTLDLRQSMRNGGGPACLRLRIVLTEAEIDAISGSVIVDEDLVDSLESWVIRHYRDELAPSDLGDPDLVEESHLALDELTQILNLPSLYPFQR